MPPDSLRYLSAADVESSLPPLARQIELAAEALRSLASGDAEMPPKIGVHPRQGALLHAMPAWLRGPDLVGMKWVSAFPGNAARSAPAIQGLILLNDPETGTLLCVMDGARITAARTAAVSGVALRLYAPRGPRHVTFLGCGVQARAHLPVIVAVLGDVTVHAFDRHADRAETFARWAGTQPGIAGASAVPDAGEAARAGEIVITAGAISKAQEMTTDWLRPAALVIAVDFAAYVSADIARSSATFAVDDRAQFLAYREAGYFDGYPDPTETLGEALARGGDEVTTGPRVSNGHVIVVHLGVGTADILFANEVLQGARRGGTGTLLPR
jgi:alanine dehydrogenase